jgi:hypothetical protein
MKNSLPVNGGPGSFREQKYDKPKYKKPIIG